MKSFIKKLEDGGYIDKDCSPKRCHKCESEDMIPINISNSLGVIEEYQMQCEECKEILGTWSYGYWGL